MAPNNARNVPPLFEGQRKIIKEGLQHQGRLIIADLGSGKTRAMLEIIKYRKKLGHIKRPVMILSTKDIVSGPWPSAIKEWTPELSFTSLVGLSPDQREETSYEATDIHLMNIDTVPLNWFAEKMFREFKSSGTMFYDMFVIDESTLIKNTVGSSRWKVVKKLATLFWEQGKYLYAMTAEPAPNGLLNMFPQVTFVRPDGDAFGTHHPTTFKSMFCDLVSKQHFKYEVRPDMVDILYERISRVSTRVKLPFSHSKGHTKNIIKIDLPADAMKKYKDMQKKFFLELGDQRISAPMAAAKMAKCWQMANGAIYDEEKNTHFIHKAKIEKLEFIYEGLNGQSLFVGYWFHSDLAAIKEAFSQKKYADDKVEYLESGVSGNESKRIQDDFNSGKCRILFGQISKVSTGLNLQHNCHHLVLFSQMYDLGHYNQIIGRLERTGQKHHVFVHHIVARGTVDEVMIAKLHDKTKTQKHLLDYLADFKEKEGIA